MKTMFIIYPLISSPFSCKLFNLGIGGTFPTQALIREPPTETVHDPQSPLRLDIEAEKVN